MRKEITKHTKTVLSEATRPRRIGEGSHTMCAMWNNGDFEVVHVCDVSRR